MNMPTAALFILLITLPAAAQGPSPGAPMPLEAQEQIDAMERAIAKLKDLQTSVDQMTAEKKRECVRAIGIEDFCDCIVQNIPVIMNFVQYVQTLALTKDDLHYDTLSPDDKKVIDAARQSRDKCCAAGRQSLTDEEVTALACFTRAAEGLGFSRLAHEAKAAPLIPPVEGLP